MSCLSTIYSLCYNQIGIDEEVIFVVLAPFIPCATIDVNLTTCHHPLS